MLKKIICLLTTVVIGMTSAAIAFAEEVVTEPSKLSFNSYSDWVADTQGNNCWYYEYTTNGRYTGFKNATWRSKAGTTVGYYGSDSSDKIIENFVAAQWGLHPASGASYMVARVWVAPYSGKVRLASVGNVRKGGQWAGKTVNATIAKTDSKKQNEEILWTKAILSADQIGEGNNYSIDVDVKQGDRIYFTVSTEINANGTTLWQTTVDYLQAAYFSSGGKEIKSVTELNEGSTLNCSVYENNVIRKDTKLFLAIYDNNGRMRAIGNTVTSDFSAEREGRADVSVVVPTLAEGESFEGWSVRLIGLVNSESEYWPVSVSNTICLK